MQMEGQSSNRIIMNKTTFYSLSWVFVATLATCAPTHSAAQQHVQLQSADKQISSKDLQAVVENNKHWATQGKVADYIPELGKADPHKIALAIVNEKGNVISTGDVHQKFTIQSISKIIALFIAVKENGENQVYSKLGYFGTDKPFNHFGNLENNGKPLNPMMNAGAIVTTASIQGEGDQAYQKILNMIRYITKNDLIDINEKVYLSEKETGHRNRGMFHILKNAGLIVGNEEKLDNYFKQCSIEVNAEDLAKIGFFFANEGTRFDGDKTYYDANLAQLIEAQMLTAGMYEYSGEYTRKIGLPSKSGVGGGITVAVPGKMGIGVYSPALDEHGNSAAGVQIILDLAKRYKLSIF